MDVKALHRQMTNYNQWKRHLDDHLQRFERWGNSHNMLSPEVLKTLKRARHLLRGDSFTIACVGEFSRGKTELINALLYTEGGRRLLPSQPGRTTMCPTEIYWDPTKAHNNCVRLLPIETRRTNTSLQNFKRIPQNWVTIHFNPADPMEARTALNQVSASKLVTPAEAAKLGFGTDELGERNAHGLVAIPSWRHALINLDHPLLRQGLRIVDTPGLNALGNEPELTLKTLPEAQAILFMLSADAGVTASDMTIWREHIQMLRDDHCTAVLALLNKIDSLWDDLSGAQEVDSSVERLRQLTARQLNLSSEHVLAVSAKHGLLAKVGHNAAQLQRSNIPLLEKMLAECVLRSQQQIVGHRLIGDSYSMIITTRNSLSRRLRECETEIAVLRNSPTTVLADTLQQLRNTIRQSHHQYHKQALSLRTSQRLLENQRAALVAPVCAGLLERQIQEAHQNLSQSWTTLGLSRAIGDFFDSVDSSIRHLEREIERANKVMTSIYERPEHNQHDGELCNRHLFRMHKERRQLRQLQARADDFRMSLNGLLTSKSTFISRFIKTLVQEVRNTYLSINRAIDFWLQEALSPLFHNNQYQKQLLEQHMMRLTQMQNQRNTHAEQVETLQTNIYQLQSALAQLEPLYQEVVRQHLDEAAPAPARHADTSATIVSLNQARQAFRSS